MRLKFKVIDFCCFVECYFLGNVTEARRIMLTEAISRLNKYSRNIALKEEKEVDEAENKNKNGELPEESHPQDPQPTAESEQERFDENSHSLTKS